MCYVMNTQTRDKIFNACVCVLRSESFMCIHRTEHQGYSVFSYAVNAQHTHTFSFSLHFKRIFT